MPETVAAGSVLPDVTTEGDATGKVYYPINLWTFIGLLLQRHYLFFQSGTIIALRENIISWTTVACRKLTHSDVSQQTELLSDPVISTQQFICQKTGHQTRKSCGYWVQRRRISDTSTGWNCWMRLWPMEIPSHSFSHLPPSIPEGRFLWAGRPFV